MGVVLCRKETCMSRDLNHTETWWNEPFNAQLSLGEQIQRAGVEFADRRAIRLPSGSWLTHGELHARAQPVRGAVMRSLKKHGGAVGCLTGTSESLYIALIASLTSASSITFLDPSLPTSLNRHSLNQIGARTLITDRSTEEYVRSLSNEDDTIILLDEVEHVSSDETVSIPDDGVITIFTSGSTGRAKGVVRPFAAMAHSIYNFSMRFESSPDDVLLYVGSPGHVGTLNDLLLSILNGYSSVPVQLSDLDLNSIYELVRDLNVNKIAMPPSLMRLFLRHAASQKGFEHDLMIVSSGEALLRSDVQLFFEVLGSGSTLWQSYGSTEAGHMFAGYYAEEHAHGTGSLPLNRVARGVEIEIVNDEGNPVATGETGQIRVRTPSLANGYTASAILPDDGFGQDDRGRYFMTGDRAQLVQPGEFIIEGRADRQINLHGRRVELGEIESAILATPGWGEASAAMVPDRSGRVILKAMVSSLADQESDVQTLRESLKLELPAFAIPTQLVSVAALPRTATGKVDLPAVADSLSESTDPTHAGPCEPPQGSTENWLADAWQAVLGVEDRPSRIIPFDEFGGDSLNALDLCLRLGQKFGIELGMDFVTAHRTISAQATALQDTGKGPTASKCVVPLRSDGTGPICVLIPGAGGHAWVYLSITDLLSNPCDLLALNLNFTSHDELMPDQLANKVLDAIDSMDKNRPLMIVGYSRGSLIACKLAQVLEEKGRPASEIALIDPSPIRAEKLTTKVLGTMRSVSRTARRRSTKKEAGRLLDEQINATRQRIAKLYRPEDTRLHSMPCSVLGTDGTVQSIRSQGNLYGRELSSLTIEATEGLSHLDLMRKQGAPFVASWLDARIARFDTNDR